MTARTYPHPLILGHLQAVTRGLPDDAGLVISHAFGDVFCRAWDQLATPINNASAAKACGQIAAAARSTYCSVTATDQETFADICARSRGARGGNADARWLLGMWGDVDIAGTGHANNDELPKTIAEAERIYADLPTPTLVVDTGGGLHVWWLLDQPVFIGDRHADIEGIVKRWQAMLLAHAGRHGYRTDSTHDLARVLRVCGTTNHKYGTDVTLHDVGGWPPGQVESDEQGWNPQPRYAFDELAALCSSFEPERPAVKERKPKPPRANRPASGSSLDILDCVHAADWADIWPPDWSYVGDETIKGISVELWRRHGAPSAYSVKCWPDGACKVWSDSIPGLPDSGFTKAEVLAWRLGLDLSDLARRIIEEGRARR